jgi:hypothetical protein
LGLRDPLPSSTVAPDNGGKGQVQTGMVADCAVKGDSFVFGTPQVRSKTQLGTSAFFVQNAGLGASNVQQYRNAPALFSRGKGAPSGAA